MIFNTPPHLKQGEKAAQMTTLAMVTDPELNASLHIWIALFKSILHLNEASLHLIKAILHLLYI